ncbi:hypothetical protein BDR06DRAFT_1004454 [Suillus hirtellus]|nr:hypothetical protein BDR06DRAFT_1004454 [Suillus hirtellus]
MHADAPKPTYPCPYPIKKAIKAAETSNLTVTKDGAVSTNGKGGRAGGKLAASDVEHPESDAEEKKKKVQLPGPSKKKGKRTVLPVKTLVRDAIGATGVDILMNELMMACDDVGTTISSSGTPLTPINTITNTEASNVADHFMTLFADENLTESDKHSQALTHMSKPKTPQGINISFKVPNTSPDIIADKDNEMNADAAPPVVTSLIDYMSNTDRESNLKPPPSTQVLKGYYDAVIHQAAA